MPVRVEKQGFVTTVILARPDARNAVDRVHADALAAAFRDFEAEDGARVAVLWGEGGTFCAGADLKAVATARGNRVVPLPEPPASGVDMASRARSEPQASGVDMASGARSEPQASGVDMASRARSEPQASGVDMTGPMGPTRMQLSKPVIAAVAGHAVAGGLELSLWCDLRVAEEGAIFGVFCRRWGVPLIDGGTIRLPRVVGQGRALDMILTGRPVGAEEALRIGLANRVVANGQARSAAEALAAEIAHFPPRCVRADRGSALEQWSLPERAALANELRHGSAVIASGETQAGAARFAGGAGRHGSFG
jgi:enoyl-CoA hydratase